MPPSPRRPQSRAAPASSNAQISLSNETVNAFLGGRTPSWMIDAQQVPSSSNLYQAQNDANLGRRRPGRPLQRLPGNLSSASTTTEDQREAHSIEPALIDRQPSSDTTRIQNVLPSPAPTDEPSPAISTQTESPKLMTGRSDGLTSGQRPPLTARNTLQRPDTTTPQSVQGQILAPVPTTTQPSSGTILQAASQAIALASGPPQDPQFPSYHGLPTLRPRLGNVAHSPVAGLAQQHYEMHASNTDGHQAKRARLGNQAASPVLQSQGSVASFMERCHELLASQVEHITSLNFCVDKCRFRVLNEACTKGDLFYVALHQIFCLSTSDAAAFRTFLVSDLATVKVAFRHLSLILRPNEHLSVYYQDWFARFPVVFPIVMHHYPFYRQILSRVLLFLQGMAKYWATLHEEIVVRRYPLLAYEITSLLQCPSPQMGHMLFTSTYRQLVADESLLPVLDSIHQLDALNEKRIKNEQPPRQAIAMMRRDIVVRYLKLIGNAQHLQTLAMQQNSRPGQPILGALNPVQPGSVPTQTQLRLEGSHLLQSQMANRADPAPSSTSSSFLRSPTNHMLMAPNNQMQLTPGHSVPSHPFLAHPLTENPGPHLPHPGPAPSNYTQQPLRRPDGSLPLQHRTGAGQGVAQNTSPAAPNQLLPESGREPHPLHRVAMPQPVLPQTGVSQSAQYLPGNHPPNQQPTFESHNPALYSWAGQMQPRAGASAHAVPSSHASSTPARPGGTAVIETTHDSNISSGGLHMIKLRSPRRRPRQLSDGRHYQFLRNFAISPMTFPPQLGLRTIKFHVSDEDLHHACKQVETNHAPFCLVQEGSLRYRLRVCLRPEDETETTESDWVVSASQWPDQMFVSFNDKIMDLRRKQHFYKDLPLELTDFLIKGENTAQISLPETVGNYKKGYKYMLAVEVIETRKHDSLRNMVENCQRLSPDITKKHIMERLRPSDSDEIIVANENLTVSMADPFSSSMFTIPVRGRHCKHLECFDLETWLQTRPGKQILGKDDLRFGEEPCMPDVWKCPICGLDARPPSLQIDEYLVQVRERLLQLGEKSAKEILVKTDGTWIPVQSSTKDAHDDDDSDDDVPLAQSRKPKSPQPQTQTTSGRKRISTPEIIEILDD